ncbi:MAG: 4Fe-4S binding protein [Clostridiales bacterium]|nr:4Fe-4S binding protein [Clostridiales bacterium]
MKKKELGNTGLYVTPVSFGVLTVGNTQLDLPLEEGAALIRYAINKGINFFDTAQYYETYPYLKEGLKGINMQASPLKRPIICTKSLCLTYEEMEYAIEESLREMSLDAIDIFLLHEVRQDPDFELRKGAWQCLIDYKAAGAIRAIGVSTHHVDVAEKMACIPECDILFPLINYASLGIRKGDGEGSCEEMAAAIKKNADVGKGVFAMKAFGGGNLTGSYIKALDYVSSIEGISSIMVGIGKKEEIDRLVEYAQGILSKDYAPDVTKKRIHIDPGDCEGCGTCLTRCPNKAIFWNKRGIAEVDHGICLTCGYCAPVCPVRAIIMW